MSVHISCIFLTHNNERNLLRFGVRIEYTGRSIQSPVLATVVPPQHPKKIDHLQIKVVACEKMWKSLARKFNMTASFALRYFLLLHDTCLI